MTERKVDHRKWLYHRKHGGKIFETEEERKWLWLRGWRDVPYPEKEKRLLGRLRSSWEEHKWLFVAIGLLLGITWTALQIYQSVQTL